VALTVPPGSTHRFPGATIHEYEGITDVARWSVDGLPVTAPALTVMHLSAIMPIKAVGSVLDDCLVTRRVRLPELFALADFWTRRGRPGGKAMWRLLASRGSDYVPPESELERRFLALLRGAGLPDPTRQFEPPWEAGRGRIDFAFVERRVLIEVDGRRWHTRERDFEKDKARDRDAQLQGWMILRFSWNEVTCRPDIVLRDILSSLGE
jgi:very-short-patch-repair endonuclease